MAILSMRYFVDQIWTKFFFFNLKQMFMTSISGRETNLPYIAQANQAFNQLFSQYLMLYALSLINVIHQAQVLEVLCYTPNKPLKTLDFIHYLEFWGLI